MAVKSYSKLDQVGKPKTLEKKTKAWTNARKTLKQIYQDKGIIRCENCGSSGMLSFAHRHKRVDTSNEELASFQDTLLLCVPCHQLIEVSKSATLALFKKLRDTL